MWTNAKKMARTSSLHGFMTHSTSVENESFLAKPGSLQKQSMHKKMGKHRAKPLESGPCQDTKDNVKWRKAEHVDCRTKCLQACHNSLACILRTPIIFVVVCLLFCLCLIHNVVGLADVVWQSLLQWVKLMGMLSLKCDLNLLTTARKLIVLTFVGMVWTFTKSSRFDPHYQSCVKCLWHVTSCTMTNWIGSHLLVVF